MLSAGRADVHETSGDVTISSYLDSSERITRNSAGVTPAFRFMGKISAITKHAACGFYLHGRICVVLWLPSRKRTPESNISTFKEKESCEEKEKRK